MLGSIALVVADLLSEWDGDMLVPGSNLFVGKEPAAPDETVTVFDYAGGKPAVREVDGQESYFYFTFQIRVRGRQYSIVSDRISKIRDYLCSLKGVEISVGSIKCHFFRCVSEPAFLDWDERDRVRFVCSFEVQVTEL